MNKEQRPPNSEPREYSRYAPLYGRVLDRNSRERHILDNVQSSMSRIDDPKSNHYSIAIITVGLPGRGKTFAGRSLSRYLQWQGIQSKCFSVAEYRRAKFKEKLDPTYYDPSNQKSFKIRLKLSNCALDDMIQWLRDGDQCQVGVFDAANITLNRRQMIHEKLTKNSIQVIFLEVICDQPEAILENFKNGAKYSPEYYGMDLSSALEDMKIRLSFYEPYYESVGENGVESMQQYIRVTNVRDSIIINRISGYLPTKIAHYLMNINQNTKHIFFVSESICSLHARSDSGSEDETAGGSSTMLCMSILAILRERLQSYVKNGQILDLMQIWSSPSPCAIKLANLLHAQAGVGSQLQIKSQLSRMVLSAFEKKKLDQIRADHPKEHEDFMENPYYHRFPGGESYYDLAVRLENVLMELEGSKSKAILLIADTTVLRCLYSYYTNVHSKVFS